ncbi:MAG: DUF6272 family protein, partial [Catalinimonas sp.]
MKWPVLTDYLDTTITERTVPPTDEQAWSPLDLLSQLRFMQRGNIIFSYRGPISDEVITSVLHLNETRFTDMALSPLVRKRLLNILIESLQNIFHHHDEDGHSDQEAILIIGRVADGFFIHTGNSLE